MSGDRWWWVGGGALFDNARNIPISQSNTDGIIALVQGSNALLIRV